MAHHNKFVSVNLNKSYGHHHPSNPNPRQPRSATTSAGGGSGMVVLSRPRSSSSTQASKLSIPPPLNLPSLRKESQKFDLTNSGTSTRPGSSGICSGPGSSSAGWTKPTTAKPVAALVGVGSEKNVFLSGEEFPSLKTAVNSKELISQKENEKKIEFSSPLKMRPQVKSTGKVTGGASLIDRDSFSLKEEKGSTFSGALPYVKLTHTSDWADDERDTGLSLPERDRGFSRNNEVFDSGGMYLYKNDMFGRSDLVGQNKSVSSWRDDRVGVSNGSMDSAYVRRDLGYGTNMQNGRSLGEGYNGKGNNGDFSNNNYNRYKGNSFQNNVVQKGLYLYGTKGMSLNDPILNFGREKRVNNTSKIDSGLDITDPFSDDPIGEVNLKVFKKKKDVEKQTDFHDPVRESFEAELERVQRIQEQERRKVMEEQERVMELVRREQEERERLVREEEERRRLIEEEAREASWRAEQERIEAVRRAEEQKIAREEEKKRVAMEEERRKEAARQKLLELEAKIARRQSENNTQEKRDSSNVQVSNDVGDWEDGERMVEHLTSTTSSGSATNNKFYDTNSLRSTSTYIERGKQVNYWKRDVYVNGANSMLHSRDQETDYHCLRRDNNGFSSTRAFPRKDGFNDFGAGPMRPSSKGSGTSEHSAGPDDFRYSRGNRWNNGGEGDQYTRNFEVDATDFLDNNERFKSYNNPYNDVDGAFSSYNRSRYASRQPRVLPPPIISPTRQSQSSIRAPADHPISSSYLDNQAIMQFQVSPRTQDLLETEVITSDRQEKDSPRCDSQSSLSVSNPPSSPTQISHDEFDEAEKQISGEEETILCEGLEVENTNENEDDDWTIENNEEIHEQEEYEEEEEEEVEDEYQEEEEEVLDGDGSNKNLDLNQNNEEQDAQNANDEMSQSVLGFDEGVEVSIPVDDNPEITSNNLEKTNQENLIDNDETSKLINESEKNLEKLVIDPVTSSSSSNTTQSFSSLSLPMTSGTSSQTEAPIRLQFGLFSGPPLIPSPIPAIQIGTIQMPLHLQPPFLQFGQLRYPSPILPLTHQNFSFVQPPTSTQNLGVSRNNQEIQNSNLQNNPSEKLPSGPIEEKKQLNLSNNDAVEQGQTDASVDNNKIRHVLGYQNMNSRRNYRSVINNRESYVYYGEAQTSNRAPGIISSSRGRRVTYAVKNSNMRPSISMQENFRTDSCMYQRRPRRSSRRTEFRVCENVDKRQVEGTEPIFRYSNNRKDAYVSKSTEWPTEPENLNSGASSAQVTSSDGQDRLPKKRVSSVENSRDEDSKGKRTLTFEEDVDVPIQSGIVRVFNQPGIEAPSDDDNFIEVRSKKRMLIDRREQREKEIKAKAKVVKAPRKHRAPQSNVIRSNSNKISYPLQGNKSQIVRSAPVISNGRVYTKVAASPALTTNMTSPTLPPIGTPAVKVDSDTRSNNLTSGQASTTPVTSSSAAKFVPGLSFDSKNIGLVNASLSLGSWGTPDINQQVMALTQSQLDDAMKPVQFDSQITSSGLSTSITEPEMPFPPSQSPHDSLLSGDRIQFGAVSLAASSNDNIAFFDEDKNPNESSVPLEDAESEAEAAASAVAVAAISNNDESIPDSKSFSSKENTEMKISAGVTSNQEVTIQSTPEESLSVSLPADLSVDTPTLPLWHPLPSPQSTSGPTVSHFPTGPHSHFPMGFDMNPIFGGPIFAFGPHDESAGTQPQPQRSTTVGSGPIGPWSQCPPPNMDSFYGPPSGFTGPYISPPGVQAPPHMVVYNHFAPVGQFSQVGLSFMGTTYIPAGKQPDWKHNPVSSSSSVGGVSEGDASNSNVMSCPRNIPNLNAPVQHLATMPSPLQMFDMPPFQSSQDLPYQARWSRVPPPPVHSVPLTMPMQQQQHQHQQQHQQPPSQQSESGVHSQSSGTQKDRFSEPHSPNESNNGAQIFRRPFNPSNSTNNSSKVSNNTKSSLRSVGIGYGDHRNAPSQRRVAYQGRPQASGSGNSKMKQIYVAKASPPSGPTTTS